MASIAPWVNFTPIKMWDDYGHTDYDAFERAYRWPLHAHVNVVSLSIGFFFPIPEVTQAIQDGYAQGIVYAQAAGNDSSVVAYPGWLPEVLAVGATGERDSIRGYSNRGPELDAVAPSDSLPTVDVSSYIGYSPQLSTCRGNDNYFCHFGGTSAAAPQVAAVAALVLSRKPGLITPTSTPEPVYEVLRHSSEDQINANDPPGFDNTYGWGRLNANKALLAVSHGDANNDGSINITDMVFIVNYIFRHGNPPWPNRLLADANCDCAVNISDAYFLNAYIFAHGPAPGICYCQ